MLSGRHGERYGTGGWYLYSTSNQYGLKVCKSIRVEGVYVRGDRDDALTRRACMASLTRNSRMEERSTARPSPPLRGCYRELVLILRKNAGERKQEGVGKRFNTGCWCYCRLIMHLRQGVGPAPLICISQRLPLSMRTSPMLAVAVRCDGMQGAGRGGRQPDGPAVPVAVTGVEGAV